MCIRDRSKNLPSSFKNNRKTKTITLENKVVTPGLIDSHTHLIFAGSREKEFEMRIKGSSYEDILKKGGGIHSTVRATRNASEEELFNSAYRRLNTFKKFGITTVEVKSGYGLNLETELKMLKVAKKLNEYHPVDVVPTFLGAHIIPEEYKQKREKYINIIINEMIPEISSKNLAKFCDVFVEKEAYSPEEAEKILTAGLEAGLKPKLHTDQFSSIGGIKLATELNASSVDHCDAITEKDLNLLKNSNIPAVLLPGAVFFISKERYAPAKKMIELKIPTVISTDFNPGSCMTQNLPLIMSIACLKMKILPSDTIISVTINAAKSLNLEKKVGSIKPGKIADLAIFDIPDYRHIVYHFGVNNCWMVIKNGEIIFEKARCD